MSEPELEHVRCGLCDADDAELCFEKPPFEIVRCRACRLMYADPQPVHASTLYESPQYFAGDAWYLDYLGHERNYRRHARRCLGILMRQAPPPARLLDVGAAAGFFLDEARRAGYVVSGLEPSAQMAGRARAVLALDVATSGLESTDLAPGSLDVVTFCDSLEHFREPRAALSRAHAALAPGGCVLVLTPNVGSLAARGLGRHWPHFTPPEHLVFFSERTLSEMLRRTGFELAHAASVGHYWSLAELANRLPGGGGLRRALAGAGKRSLYLNVGDLLAIAKRR